MPTYNVQADLTNGAIHVVAKDGRRYTLDELEAAELRARAGDRAAQALLCQVDLSRDCDGHPVANDEAVAAAQRTIAAVPPLPDGGGCRAPP